MNSHTALCLGRSCQAVQLPGASVNVRQATKSQGQNSREAAQQRNSSAFTLGTRELIDSMEIFLLCQYPVLWCFEKMCISCPRGH